MKRLVGDKLDSRSDLCYFVGYLVDTMGYEFYFVSEAKVFVSRNVVFLEKEFLYDRKYSRVELEVVRDDEPQLKFMH